jgi:hypothetical protein
MYKRACLFCVCMCMGLSRYVCECLVVCRGALIFYERSFANCKQPLRKGF